MTKGLHERLHALRDARGRRVREVWIAWAKEQPDLDSHSGWLVPYDEMDEADKEVDRRIGSALWGDGFRDGLEYGLQMAAKMAGQEKVDGP